MIRSRLLGFAAIAIATVLGTLHATTPGLAQSYPTSNPTYVPAAVLGTQSLTTTGSSTIFLVNNVSTVYLRVGGTFSGLVATVQGTESRAASPTWTAIPSTLVGGSSRGLITAAGLYRIDSAGLAGLRVNVTTLTGTNVTLGFSAGAGFGVAAPEQGYRATVVGLTPAASATDLVEIVGSATTTVSVQRVTCSALSTAIGAAKLTAVKRSAANSAGTSSAVTAVAVDSSNNAATAALKAYTANPTLGAAVGTVAAGVLVTTPAATSTIAATPLVFDFTANPVVLRGVAQGLSVNGNAASLPGGTALSCVVEFTER